MTEKLPEPEPPASAEEVPNWLQRRRERDAELEALNELGRTLAGKYPAPVLRVYAGTLRRHRPRRR